MFNRITDFIKSQPSRAIYVVPILIVAAILIFSFVASSLDKTPALTEGMGRTIKVSEVELKEKYGIVIDFIGVTPMMIGTGEVIDVEMRILNFEKAMLLLGDQDINPKLVLEDPNAMPMDPEKAIKSSMMHEYMFPNMGNLVQPGDKLLILIGEVQLGPFISK